MNKPNQIRIVIVDDHPVVRSGLRHVEELDERLRVVGEAADGAGAVAESRRLQPDVVLLDYRLPGMSGGEVCSRLKAVTKARVLFLSSFADAPTVNAALDAGGDGYLLKENDAQKIVDAILAVHRGGMVIDPAIARFTVARARTEAESKGPAGSEFSSQEKRVLVELASGKPDKEIAEVLRLEPKTVRNYLAHIYRKLGVRSRTQAALWYHRNPMGREGEGDGGDDSTR